MSKYDSINTAAELIKEIQMNGLSTIQEDLNRAADIVGNTAIEELDRIANDIGRNNEKGEPDPKGSWSSSRKATQSTFYSLISHIWNWEDVTRFWNQHSNPEREELVELRKAAKKLTEENEKLAKRREELLASESELGQKVWEESQKSFKIQEKLDEASREIVQLKARLYDLMIAQDGRA